MARKNYECVECEALFKISHTLDENYYTVTNCPFCGAEMEDKEEDDEDLS